MIGIDVSYAQGNVDWAEMKESGVAFAFIKVSQGKGLRDPAVGPFPDPQFHRNMQEAKAQGIPVGVYHYLTASTVEEAGREAAYFLSLILPYKEDIALWAVCDAEEDAFLPRDRETLGAVIRAFLEPIRAAGFRPMLYSNPNYLTYRLPPMPEYDLWLAYWGVPEAKALAYNPKVWQYGIESRGGQRQVDVNRGYFSLGTEGETRLSLPRRRRPKDVPIAGGPLRPSFGPAGTGGIFPHENPLY